MGIPKAVTMRLAAVFFCGMSALTGLPSALGAEKAALGAEKAALGAEKAAPVPEAAVEQLPSELCLGCHGNQGFAVPGADGKPRNLHVIPEKFSNSVHGKRLCVECHKEITKVPHERIDNLKVSCVACHEKLWDQAKKEGTTREHAHLGAVVGQIDRYMKSIHARPSMADQSHTNATCYNCHDAHYVYPAGSAERQEWRLNIPNKCGVCHVKEREVYATSVHGREVLEKQNPKAAICSDCHTTHDIEDTEKDATRLVITKKCGGCHEENLKSYLGTYHGQVNTLGYAYTAKCFDCHGNHGIQRVDDVNSSVHPDNRLQTCQKCHKGATAGFVTFSPHGNTHDFKRYPLLWVASKFMIGLLLGVFAFFWLHSALWFYREYKDRQEGKGHNTHVKAEAIPGKPPEKYFRRFALGWRIAHLCFAISVMTLVLTGMAVFYAETSWAKTIVGALGGPRAAALIHRVCAGIMLSIFFVHLVYVARKLYRARQTFTWLGPNSMVPNLRDLEGAISMFKWFFGKGPRPMFDRWTYWEKFDYWAVFWGMGIIGGSGMMLAFPNVTASILPGWVFNIATLIHGEEAFLAAVFLFTVHFFNNHLRPDKYPPPDVVMFTGAVALDEFKREHTLEYQRLVDSGELEQYLVDAPSPQFTQGARILGIVLILCGLTLLALVVTGFLGDAFGGH